MPRDKKQEKIFVLDTSVLLYDYDAVKNFQKHDVAIPITVLEELDTFKKGNNVINLHAREFIRYLDKISDQNMLQKWIPLMASCVYCRMKTAVPTLKKCLEAIKMTTAF